MILKVKISVDEFHLFTDVSDLRYTTPKYPHMVAPEDSQEYMSRIHTGEPSEPHIKETLEDGGDDSDKTPLYFSEKYEFYYLADIVRSMPTKDGGFVPHIVNKCDVRRIKFHNEKRGRDCILYTDHPIFICSDKGETIEKLS